MEISEEDKKKIEELRELVKDDLTDYYDTDFNILRWLQGHNNLSISEIARKLRHHLKLRKAWNLDEFHLKERNHPIHNHWKYGITGESGIIENVIVNIEQCGKTDYNGMMESFSIMEIMRARTLDLEQMLAQVMSIERKTGKQAYILYVMDITGLEYNKHLYNLVTGSMKSLADFMAEHYVEMIKFFVPTCVPNFANALFVVVKPLLPEKTRDKVRLIPEHNWRKDILEFAKPIVLPSIWNDENHNFSANIDLPIKYPTDMYYSNQTHEKLSNLETIYISAGKIHTVCNYLKKGSRLKWWCRGNRNFGFGVFWSEKEKIADYFIANQVSPCFPWMPDPSLVPMEDSIIVDRDAYYHVWVSNERSWWFTLEAQLAVKFGEL
ncbi:unnamed protein product [Caenorhabditis angaria]|uniref:CRAL-TRIO domain-containing protein n=1 Tax=Caenorhabditis angaria TaxID=860376 RepID=A0A9P1NBI3_9PELO|nr:unnamed protein product [Caenorhabditis angaria]